MAGPGRAKMEPPPQDYIHTYISGLALHQCHLNICRYVVYNRKAVLLQAILLCLFAASYFTCTSFLLATETIGRKNHSLEQTRAVLFVSRFFFCPLMFFLGSISIEAEI